MNPGNFQTDYSGREYDYDVPDRNNCDRCQENAWAVGIPAWTCDQKLYCAFCLSEQDHQDNIADYLKDAETHEDLQ